MKLSEYIKAERGNGKALAEKLVIAPSYLSQIAAFPNGPSPATCVAIEIHTNGQVTRQELRPNDWRSIWPELAAAEAALAAHAARVGHRRRATDTPAKAS